MHEKLALLGAHIIPYNLWVQCAIVVKITDLTKDGVMTTLIWSGISYRFNNSFFVLSTLVYLRFMFIFKVNTHCLSFNSTLSITNFQIQHCLHKIQFYKNYVCLGNYFKGQLFTYLSYYFLFPFVPNKSWRPYL